ncbi:hypothetical protein [Tenacibaculum sp. C7A-26P2]|uniref:hypothetical protein n=1 Tax=Tenacibaculum sp. C7A-26P2 TaxID=3447504 RepID=UPI003F84800B
MSKKRFIDISTLPKTWRKLDSNLKLTWYWLWNNCDPSGVWEIDEDFFEFENGFEIDTSSLTKALPNEIEASNGKVLLKNYIVINYCDFSKLKENYNPHKPLFRSIKKNNLKLQPSLNQACFKLVEEEEDVEEDVDVDVDEIKSEKIKKRITGNLTEKSFSNEVEKCYKNCLIHFPVNLHPKDDVIFKWKETIDKLNRIDRIPFKLIEEIVNKTRADRFWATNFLSIPKLRKNNPDGIPYVVVFNEKFIKNAKKIKSINNSEPTGTIYSEDFYRKHTSGFGSNGG